MKRVNKIISKILVLTIIATIVCGSLAGCSNTDSATKNSIAEGKNVTKVEKGNSESINTDKTDTLKKAERGDKKVKAENKKEPVIVDTKYTKELLMLSLLSSEDTNTMISPLSINLALSMVANGIDEQGKEKLEEYFGCSINELNSLNKEIIENQDPSILSIANSVWVRDGYSEELNDTFKSILESQYLATLDVFDTSVNKINDWVSSKTNGMIPSIIDSLPDSMKLMLINAIYFNGKWENDFIGSETKSEDFTLSNGETIKCDMMNGEGDSYFESDQAIAFRKKYDGGYSFIGLQLKENTGDSLNLSQLDLQKLLDSETYSYEVEIKIPKFESNYTASLNDTIKQLGLSEVLGSTAMTGVVNNEALGISSILHKTAIKMDEKGTEASAVTGAVVAMSSLQQPKELKQVFLDKPFIYMIVNARNEIVFLGEMNNPTVINCD